ncbi:MAG: S8 family serine peptidase [Chitinophagaceae bacterium]|nr:S8 family serine peptidase [Chitinophagaceae bacterium]
MHKFSVRVLLIMITVGFSLPLFSQLRTNTEVLKQAAVRQAAKEKELYARLQTLAKEKGWEMVIKRPNGGIAILVGIDDFGNPLYNATDNNIAAAATIGTIHLWPGGSTGLNLSGSSNAVKNKLALWDGGSVRGTHVELTGRVVQRDNNPGAQSDHATHVAGTLIATGVNPVAKGMSFGQQQLVAYDFAGDASEMLNEAPNLLVSNHSYGSLAGWEFNNNRWEFWGLAGSTEDYQFGNYGNIAQLWDSIAYNAPFYLIVKSAGNKRNENGPAEGQPFWRRNASGVFEQVPSRPPGLSSNNGFDIIQSYGNSKNILTVGAVNAIGFGYNNPQDVMQSTFTSWGPTDDGRIKPDVVANGVGLLSSIATSDNAYATFSGTSMSSPSAAGSLLLLQEYYNQLHPGTFMRSASLKGLVIHTADEAGGGPGPDYQNGWGLINMVRAASVITANNTTHLMQERQLDNTDNATYSLPVVASGNGKIVATISWTDPKADVEPLATALNNATRKLVNDLDIVIKRGATTYRPWVLNPAVPTADATTGDNILDNVEKVEISDVIPGQTYTIEITKKGTLARGLQAYTLIASGVGGQPYCASNPTSTSGARIDSVSFSNVQNKNVAGCTSYSNFTGVTGNLQPGQTLPLFIRLNSCDATSVGKIVKVYIDANNDGDFTDAGENVATSGVINGNGDFSTNITMPAGLTPGKVTILRIVMQETSTAADVTPCGTYARGETQDYRIMASTPSLDFGVPGLISPISGDCANPAQYLTVRVRNYGTADKNNISLQAVIKQGATTIATLNATYTDSIYALTEETYTFQTPFATLPSTTYTVTVTATFPGDQDPSNNVLSTSFTTGAAGTNPAGTAIVCGTTAQLSVTSPTNELYNWYTSTTAPAPIATGPNVSTTTIVPTYYLSKNEISTKLGPQNKMVFPEGGYNSFTGNMVRITTSMPVTLETVRLYIGTSGKITFLLREIVSYNETTGAYSYFPVASRTIDVTATAPTPPVLGQQNNDPNDLGAIFYLGLNIPTAGNYGIVIQCENGASIFRNNNITTNPYPFSIPGVISITGNSAILAGDPNYFQKFYYFLYDVTVKVSSGCPSARVAVVPTTATAPVITVAGNVLTSTAAVSYQWFKNGVAISGAFNQTYTATESGTYRVDAYYGPGCTLSSSDVTVTVTPVVNVDPDEIGLIVSPNPTTTGQFDIQLQTRTRANLHIALLNTAGQKVYQKTVSNFIGRFTETVRPGNVSAGIYYLQVQHDKKMYVLKVVVL